MNSQDSTFLFVGYDLNKERGEVKFHYVIRFTDTTEYFTEKLIFSIKGVNFSKIPRGLLKLLLDNLMLILGISYWKLYCPKKIEIADNWLTKEQAEFWNTVYTKGLGEFFYKNGVDFRGLVQFPYVSSHPGGSEATDRISSSFKGDSIASLQNDKTFKDRSFLMLGGGKDSIVAAELLKRDKKTFTAFVINDYSIQKELIKLLGVDSIIVQRKIDPKLLELGKQKDAYNGHVPVSAIYAFIALFAAAIYDYRYIISSNEASSNYGNVEYLGETINHQWSKSLEFETLFSDYVKKYLTTNIYYFSILRPLYEIKIAQLFVKYPKYFSAFSSCNRNFRIKHERIWKWCGQCAKCAFIFVTLAAFLPKEEVVKIFGKNLFADASLINTYKELLGIRGIKPFECVGTPDEVTLAFYLVYKKGKFNNDIIMRMFGKEITPRFSSVRQLGKKLLSALGEHRIPENFRNVLTV